MKKITAFLLMLIYSSFCEAFAFSELYYVKNAYTDTVKSIVQEKFDSADFNLTKYNPYYGVSKYDSSEYAIVILQQSGQNMFYYYQSNDNKKINNSILKELKRSGYIYEQSQNVNILSLYDNLAQEVRGGVTQENKYTFEDTPAVVPSAQNTNTVQPVQNNTLRGSVAQIASGTVLNVYLQTPINTAQASKGDKIVAVLMKDVTYNGVTVFPQGSILNGTLTKATHASYGSRNGKVVINFDQLVTPENKTYNISAEKIDFSVTNDGKLTRTASGVAMGAVAGALVGLLFAALGDSHNYGKAAAIGAGVGAGSALIGSTAERGVDAEIPSFTEMELTLTSPVSVTVSY